MTDVKYISGHPICDVTARAALAEKADTDDVGNLSQLETTAKDNLVSAINEAVTGTNERLHDVIDGITSITINKTASINGNFTQQYIRDNGTIGSSTTTCTSMYNAFPSKRIKYSVPTGFKISAIAEYSEQSGNAFTRFIQKSDSTESDFAANSSKFYCISIRKTDETAFTLDEIPTEAEQYVIEEFTDETLKLSGKSADSKAVGDKFDKINDKIDNIGIATYQQLLFRQGSISTTTGYDIEASNRLRTYNYFTGKFQIRVGENIKYSIRTYLSDGTYVNASDWNTDSLSLDINETNKVRFVIAYINDAEITPESDIDFEVYTISYTDETLERIGKPADAKVVGDELGRLKSNFIDDVAVSWERGTLTTYNGMPTAADNVIRSGNFIEAASVTVKNTVSSTSVYGLRYYDEYKSFIFSDSEIRTGVTELNDIINSNPEVAFFKIITRYDDRRVLTDEDVQTLASACSITKELNLKTIIDDIKSESISTIEPSPNSNVLGNISIKAAKTINFTDGTAPIIDWYLLQDIAGNFYISKDLMTKKYLFTFVPPSGNVANWSAGITGNNDVIFVANAAGLSAPNGRLNDANRVNPVCYLSSENYGEMHTIDFGTSLKPCGWLGNVGYTVLPTGRIAFAEYTRGVVQTANVWIIDGAVNDSNNWQITWSSNIIDTTDTTTNGIKHCHEMQWDFYTGVLYFGTGDSPTGSYSYYSLDGGETWNLLYGPNKDRCRRLTYVFTEEKVYWASDSYESEYHHFFIAERNANGVVDIENATRISLDSTNAQACYGCVYLQSLNLVAMMDRIDSDGRAIYNWYCYDITENQVVKIGEIKSVNGVNSHLGFRCNFVDWYPVDDIINVGFNPSSGAVNPDTNVNALCGNLGGTQGDGSTRINNLALSLFKRGNSMSFRARTRWI
ncbi:MAG: hypothetical protein IIZ78_01105 [Clostridiales bacterium]|nr:hypothetical protein [Clostridiales bacterium]